MVHEPFYELDGQIVIDLPGARGIFTTASWGDVRCEVATIAERLGVRIARARQVHGTTVIEVDGADVSDLEADALLTTQAGVAPMVLSADCVPVLLAGGGAVAAVHAGWKGLRDGVLTTALERLRSMVPEAKFVAAIGPAAGVCCYEVGDEVHAAFTERDEDFRVGQNLDLKAIAGAQLRALGVGEVYDTGVCTICSDPGRLFSHRRDHGRTGRQGGIVWLT